VTHVEHVPPRHVAAAIANLGADEVRKAWRYLDAWSAMANAGVPLATIRECLLEPLDTGPCRAVFEWQASGARGLACLVGDPGVGKTYAAARWAVLRHLQRQSTTWVAAPSLALLGHRAREARITELADRSAVVLDDVGAGLTQGDYLRDQLLGLLQHRIDGNGGRLGSTILISNGTVAQLKEWLGPRIVDRCKISGGFGEITSRESLRARATVELDALGRGPEWYRAHRLVETVGCREAHRVDEDGRPRTDLDVGDALDREARRDGYAPCKAARELLGLTQTAVEVEAQRLAQVEISLARSVGAQFGVDLDARLLSLEGVAALLAGKVRQQQLAARERYADEVRAVSTRARRYEDNADPVEARPAPAWTHGPDGRKRLRKLGFLVAEVGEGRWQTRRKLGDVVQILATGSPTDHAAWEIAAKLCADPDPQLEAL
jgi:hypothetical protein